MLRVSLEADSSQVKPPDEKGAPLTVCFQPVRLSAKPRTGPGPVEILRQYLGVVLSHCVYGKLLSNRKRLRSLWSPVLSGLTGRNSSASGSNFAL